jgi:tetratricopeptide (TPR) repeat protein
MSSSSRNTRRADSLRRRCALGAVLALTFASGAALADGGPRFVFTVYTDAMGGGEIAAGHYQAALNDLRRHPDTMGPDASTTNTNRCVAYSMTQQWQEAHIACDAAVRAATDMIRTSPAWWGWGSAPGYDDLALAYANRAVLSWLSQDTSAAQKDLAKALELSPHSEFVAQNVTALKAHHGLALAVASRPQS